ncbi:phage tail terminator-like protein [Ursidibacter arcticus]
MKSTIRSIIQTHLTELGKFNTAWEGVNNKVELPYQSVFLNISSTTTSIISDRPLATETGFLQVTLHYPLGNGTKAIEQRADEIRRHFYGKSFIEDGIQVVIHSPPHLGGTFLMDDKLVMPMTINFTAYELGE